MTRPPWRRPSHGFSESDGDESGSSILPRFLAPRGPRGTEQASGAVAYRTGSGSAAPPCSHVRAADRGVSLGIASVQGSAALEFPPDSAVLRPPAGGEVSRTGWAA